MSDRAIDIDFLSPGEKQQLSGLSRDPGYDVLIKVMKAAATQSMEKLMLMDPTNEKAVIAQQQVARATHAFVTKLVLTIEFEKQEQSTEEEEQIV